MRFLPILLLVASASPALACPENARCVTEAALRTEVSASRRPVSLRIEQAPDDDQWNLRSEPRKHLDAAVFTPASGRRVIMDHLPGYRAESMSIVVAPVVIRSRAFKTIAAVGVIIDF